MDSAVEMLDVSNDAPIIHHQGATYTIKEYKILQSANKSTSEQTNDNYPGEGIENMQDKSSASLSENTESMSVANQDSLSQELFDEIHPQGS